jgi:hypothetical protein
MKEIRSREIILAQLLEGLNQSSGSAGHMIHHHQDSRWFKTRAILDAVKKMIVQYSVEPLLAPKPKVVK